MFETNVNYEKLEKILEEAKKEEKGALALIRNGVVLAVFDCDAYATDIVCKACEIARRTLKPENIDLYYVIIENNIIQKDILIQKNIIKEELENYQVIGEHIYELDSEELKDELIKYAKDVLLDILYRSDAYFELNMQNNIKVYNSCVYYIFEQVKKLYDLRHTIYTDSNSFILHGTYKDVVSTNFVDCKINLNKKTKRNIIKEIKNSGLSKVAKKEIISRVKAY